MRRGKYISVPVTSKMCNFHKNQDITFVKVVFYKGGIGLFLKKSVVSYDAPYLLHIP